MPPAVLRWLAMMSPALAIKVSISSRVRALPPVIAIIWRSIMIASGSSPGSSGISRS